MGIYLLRAINTCFYKGELTDSLKRLLLKYWRPISLLNTSYKLASSCISERGKAVLPSIINDDQTGLLRGDILEKTLEFCTIFCIIRKNMDYRECCFWLIYRKCHGIFCLEF